MEVKLRKEAAVLPSLEYFHPEYMSLVSPHPILKTAGSSPYQVSMSIVQSIMLSGRYRTEQLCRHWSQNKLGVCLLPSCQGLGLKEDLRHILSVCGSLEPVRKNLQSFTIKYAEPHVFLHSLVSMFDNPTDSLFPQLLIDCSALPQVISATQIFGFDVLQHMFRITRTWCFSLHKTRMKFLSRRHLY